MKENTGKAQIDPRQERLAKALRDNLKRRKAQARARTAATPREDERASEGSAWKD